MNNISFLGKGIGFPFSVDKNGSIAFSQFEKSVEESIFIILSTKTGERIMNPEFGCKLHELLFEENTPETRGLASHYVKQALTDFENRIILKEVEVVPSGDSEISIHIEYQLKDTNSFYNYVYPFYLIEKP